MKIKKYRYKEIKEREKELLREYKGRLYRYRSDWIKENRAKRALLNVQEEPISRAEYYQRYKNFLKSEWWFSLRRRKLDKDPFCFVCRSPDNLQVHHAGYKYLWKGQPEGALKDTYVLCRECHKLIHDEQYRKGLKYEDTKGIIQGLKYQTMKARKMVEEINDLSWIK